MTEPIFDPENERRPYIAVNAVILKTLHEKPHILLGKRKNVAGAGFYYLPGGHIKMKETIPQALIREVKEECALDITAGRMLWVEENFEGAHHITFYYEALTDDPSIEPQNVEPHKCEGWGWYPIDNPPKPLWVTLEQFLKEYNTRTRIARFATVGQDYTGSAVVTVILRRKDKVPLNLESDNISINDLEIFLQKRNAKIRGGGVWSCPGGEIEWCESIEQALVREAKEEMGIDITVGEHIFTVQQIEPAKGKHWLVHMYLCTIKAGETINQEPDKFDEIQWFPLRDLPTPLDRGITEIRQKLIDRLKAVQIHSQDG